MLIVAAGFLFSLVVWWAQKKERARQFPPGLCAICNVPVHLKGNNYIHDDTGQVMAPTVWEHPEWYGPQRFHHAVTPSTPAEQAMYRR